MYMELRGSNDIASGALPITPRTLETIIRLSCAHAKLRLSALVELQDVEEAYAVMRFALLNETSADKKLADIDEDDDDDDAAAGGGGGSDDEDDDGDDAPGGKPNENSASKRRRRQARRGAEEEEEEEEGDVSAPKRARARAGGKTADAKDAGEGSSSNGASSAGAASKQFKATNNLPTIDPDSARVGTALSLPLSLLHSLPLPLAFTLSLSLSLSLSRSRSLALALSLSRSLALSLSLSLSRFRSLALSHLLSLSRFLSPPLPFPPFLFLSMMFLSSLWVCKYIVYMYSDSLCKITRTHTHLQCQSGRWSRSAGETMAIWLSLRLSSPLSRSRCVRVGCMRLCPRFHASFYLSL